MLKDLVGIYEKEKGQDDVEVATTLNALGNLYIDLKRLSFHAIFSE